MTESILGRLKKAYNQGYELTEAERENQKRILGEVLLNVISGKRDPEVDREIAELQKSIRSKRKRCFDGVKELLTTEI